MGKFIIDNILIEKTQKDINTGIKYEFGSGLNVIYGENEAGKSSLMKFIKDSLFKQKGGESGKIWFRIEKNDNKLLSYRADINTAKSPELRCKIFNTDDNIECSGNIIESEINRIYFEQGFYINLDDLMKIQNKSVSELINLIKDPFVDKIKKYSDKTEAEIQSIVGKDGKLKKDIKEILSNLKSLDEDILNLSTRENQYNDCLKNIARLNSEIENVSKTEEYISAAENIGRLSIEEGIKAEELKKLQSEFNQKLFEKQRNLSEIFENSGKFYSNQELIEKNNQKLEDVLKNIKSQREKLSLNYRLSSDDETIKNFVINEDDIYKLKSIIKSLSDIQSEIKAKEANLENIKTEILKTELAYKSLVKDYSSYDLDAVNTLSREIEEGLNEYYALSAEINSDEKNLKEISTNANLKNVLIYGIIIFAVIGGIIISTINKSEMSSLFLGITALIVTVIFGYKQLDGADKQKKFHLTRKKNQIDNILNNLKNKACNFDKNFRSDEQDFSLHIKLNNLNQNLKEIIKNNNEKELAEEKEKSNNNTIKELYEKLQCLKDEADLCIDKTIFPNGISPEDYIGVTDIIKNLKKELIEKENIIKEIKEGETINKNITDSIKDFINNTGITMQYTGDMKEFTENLNNISVRNSEIKKDIDMKQASLADLQEKVRIEEDKKRKYEAEIEYEEPLAEPEVQKEMLKTKKEDLKKELKQVEFRKNDLEKLGNMADLKSQKKIFTDKYRCIIKKLLINKLQSNIVSSAQKDFDRTQPDLVNAEKFLYELTNRKYNKINLELQEIETPEGRIKKWDELSRGTKEQLYLALRLGLASNYSKDKITLTPNGKSDLPLIIDDAFVNFDMNRTKNTLKCLEEFSKTNQILYFTCHKNTIETVLNNLKIEYNKINL